MENPAVLIRCDGSHLIGMGHVMRCLALAEALKEEQGCRVCFALRQGEGAKGIIEDRGFDTFLAPQEATDKGAASWLGPLARAFDALVLDVIDDLAPSFVAKLGAEGALVVTIDDGSDRRLVCDLAFYPPAPQVQELNWRGFDGKLHAGFEWVILRRDLKDVSKKKRPAANKAKKGAAKVLVTMGGSDPAGLTVRAARVLKAIGSARAQYVLGPAFRGRSELTAALDNSLFPYDIFENAPNLPEVMSRADLAVGSFGVTAYELAALGVPAVYLCLTEDHAASASALHDREIARSLGVYEKVSPKTLRDTVKGLLADEPRRQAMSQLAIKTVDGNGASRVGSAVALALRSKTNGPR